MSDKWKTEEFPKIFLYEELIVGKRNLERPQLLYHDVCKRDMKELNKFKDLVMDRCKWSSYFPL